MPTNVKTLVVAALAQQPVVYLDDFSIEWVEVDPDRRCSECGEPYRRTHGGYGSVCYLCEHPWFDGRFVEPATAGQDAVTGRPRATSTKR